MCVKVKMCNCRTKKKADIGMIGLAAMGKNLILNMCSKGFLVCAYNRTTEKVDAFLKHEAKGAKVIGARSLPELVSTLKSPRIVMIMVKAGQPVEELVYQLSFLLEAGDIIVDGGNSQCEDTIRRIDSLKHQGISYVGCGVSVAAQGSHGPSLMPGGDSAAWPFLKPIFQEICAEVEGLPCCDWVGEGGAGHFVKMVHNGIEYGDMQLISEAYDIMRALGTKQGQMADVFAKWNEAELNSYLVGITSDILNYTENKSYLLQRIRDVCNRKGAGKWLIAEALKANVPLTLTGEAVFSRCLSAMKSDRINASRKLKGPKIKALIEDHKRFFNYIKHAVYCSKIVSYSQAFILLRQTASLNHWNMNCGSIANMWRGGCVIRSVLLANIAEAFNRDSLLTNVMMDGFFRRALDQGQSAWREVIANGVRWGIPLPAMSSALAYYDGFRTEKLPANLLQAQRDYFGAHTYELEKYAGIFFHNNWTGKGGNATSSIYRA